jgi:hypothetical protein
LLLRSVVEIAPDPATRGICAPTRRARDARGSSSMTAFETAVATSSANSTSRDLGVLGELLTGGSRRDDRAPNASLGQDRRADR